MLPVAPRGRGCGFDVPLFEHACFSRPGVPVRVEGRVCVHRAGWEDAAVRAAGAARGGARGGKSHAGFGREDVGGEGEEHVWGFGL